MQGTRRVSEVEHQWIPMPDGVRLAARIWFPEGVERAPALLEIIPYRKRDLVRARDERNHPVFAGHGYVTLRVDMRGSGDSEGHMPDMYAPDELADTRHVIEWIAAQAWCSGRVGLFGTSWGGTASLQAAIDPPAALGAVIANCATVDRFEDDIHWMGGCLLTDSVEWGATLPAILAAPPDCATVGEGWREHWHMRLDRLAQPFDAWLRHATRGRYWRNGSVRFELERLGCPVLAIGGWSDRYSNNVMPLVEQRPDLCFGIVGPWGHHYPDQGQPGPALDFQALALEWWDHWLRRSTPEAPDWPRLRLWRREFDAPRDRIEMRAGEWLAFDDANARRHCTARLVDHALEVRPEGESVAGGAGGAHRVPFNPTHGERAGDTGYFGRVGGAPLEQSPDDARALCFDGMPLDTPLDVSGRITLGVSVARRRKAAQLVARLCDVAPDGRSNLVTRTVLNLALDASLDAGRAFAADRHEHYSLRFPATCYRFRPGHRLRLALAASYWPLVWPVREDPDMHVDAGLVLELPALADGQPSDDLARLRSLEGAQRHTGRPRSEAPLERMAAEHCEGRARMGWRQPPNVVEFAGIGTTLRVASSAEYAVTLTAPVEASCRMRYALTLTRPDGTVEIVSSLEVDGASDGPLKQSSNIEHSWHDLPERTCDPARQP